MSKNNSATTDLLKRLYEKKAQEGDGVISPSLLPLEVITDQQIPSLQHGQYLQMSPMLKERFQFINRWDNATLSFTWLSLYDMENAWINGSIQEAIGLRKTHWPTSVLNHHPFSELALFAIDIDEGNEIYLVFNDMEEPHVVSYFGAQEKRYDNLQIYLLTWL